MTDIKPGIYTDLTNAQYHSVPALNASGIKAFSRSPAHFKSQQLGLEKLDLFDRQQEKFNIGSAFHIKVLEPDIYEKEVVIMPETKKGNVWKEFKENARKENLIPISQVQHDQVLSMSQSVHSHKFTKKMLDSAKHKELSIFWNDQDYGFLCKVRVDFYSPKFRLVGDLKSTVDASEKKFTRSFYEYGYNLQAVWYFDSFKSEVDAGVLKFSFVVCEKSDPYAVNVFTVSDETMDRGRNIVDDIRKEYAKCLESDNWPAYTEKLYEL